MKQIIFLLLIFSSCKGTEKVQSESKKWKNQAITILGEDYKSKVSPDKTKVLAYVIKTTTKVTMFELSWTVFDAKAGNLICQGKDAASKVEWHGNAKLKLSKAMEMVQSNKDNRYQVAIDLSDCKQYKLNEK